MRTRIKICGFTQPSDALYAANLGVDALGLVFYAKSPRHVSIEQAIEITSVLPAFVSTVGLFVNETAASIRAVLAQVPLDCLQFHGDESPQDCRLYAKPYLKAVRVQQDTDICQLAEQYHDAAGLLLDAYNPHAHGGTGHVFDWQLIPKQCRLPIILAGGLDVSNAKQAIEAVKPYALDISSGVEQQKGIKDPAKMRAFIQQVIEADLENL
jgi:phosphoribosylanthranilate isomerase